MGWDVTIFRQRENLDRPAQKDSLTGDELAAWHEGTSSWINELEKVGDIIDLGVDGLRWRHTARAERIMPRLLEVEKWHREFDLNPISKLCADEWLIVDRWDTS